MFVHWSVMRKRSMPSKWPRIFVLRYWSITCHRWHWNIYNLISITVSRWTIIVLKRKKCPKMLITKKFFKQLFSQASFKVLTFLRTWSITCHRWHWNIYNLISITVSRWTIIVLRRKKCPKMLITKQFFKQLFSQASFKVLNVFAP